MRNEVLPRIERAREAIEAGLGSNELGLLADLPRIPPPAGCFELLKCVDASEASLQPLGALEAQVKNRYGSVSDTLLERTLLLRSAIHVLGYLYDFPVGPETKELFCQEFEFFADPPQRWKGHFRVGDVRFKEMAKIATLRRFPAGQMHWEVTGLPRSLLLTIPRGSALTILRAAAKLRGFSPVWEMHVNARRRNSLVMLESESYRTYSCVAQSMALQPQVKGVITGGWFYDPQLAEVSPHLAWMGRSLVEGGAVLVDLGEAPASGAVLNSSKRRRELYNSGRYKPKNYLAVWARKDLLSWAAAHAEHGAAGGA